MTFGKMAIGVIVGLFVIAGLLLYIFQDKYIFYEYLSKEGEEITRKCNQMTLSNLTESICIRTNIFSEDGRVQEIKYFNRSNLTTIDIIGDDAKIVRRDIFDVNGNIRVRIYYLNEMQIHKHFLDEKGKIILSKPIIPLILRSIGY